MDFVRVSVLFALLLGVSPAFAAEEAPQSFSLDGKIYTDATATTPLLGTGTLKLQIVDASETCVLYEETQPYDTTATNGSFNIEVGEATSPVSKRSAGDSGHKLSDVFLNDGSLITGKLVSNGTACTGSATAGSQRYVRITVTPTSGSPRVLSPNLPLSSIPSAMVAENAQSLSGKTASQFVGINTTSPAVLSQSNLENIFSTTNYPKLTDLLSGNSADYVKAMTNNSIQIPSSGSTPSTPAAGQLWYQGGELKFWDGSSAQTLGTSGSGITSLGIGTGLTPAGTISAGGSTISVDVGIGTGQIVQVQTGGKLPVLDGSNLTNLKDTAISGDLSVTTVTTSGSATIGSNVSATGYVSSAETRTSSLKIFNGADSLEFLAPSLSGSTSFTLPAVRPGVSGYVLSSDTSGVMNWVPQNSSGLSAVSNTATLAQDKIWIGDSGGKAQEKALSGDVSLVASGAATVTGIRGAAVSAAPTATGQVLRYNQITSELEPAYLSMFDLRSTVTGSSAFGGVGCLANQTLTWTAATDNLACSDISLPATQITGNLPASSITNTAAGNIASTTVQAALNELDTEKVAKNGDTMTGTLTLPANGLVVGTNQFVITGGNVLASGSVGVGTSGPGTSLDLSQKTDAIALPMGTTAQRPSSPVNGYTRYNTDLKGVEAYVNGDWQQISSGVSPTASEDGQSLRWNNTTKQFDWFTAGAAGSGIGTLNGLTATSQNFGIGTGGTAPNFDSQTLTHTLNIPMASTASVTAGLISKTEYDTFNSKLGTATSFSGDVSGTYNATSVDKIKGKAVTTPTASGQMLVYDGSGLTPVVMSGDATMIADGTMTLKNTGSVGTYFKVTTDAQGRVVSGATGLGTTEIPDLPWSKITSGTPTNLAGYGITDAVQNAGNTPSIQSGLDASRPSSGWTAGRIYIASDAKKIYRDDGTQWVEMAPATAAGVTSVEAGSGLSGGTISSTGTISLSAATQNGLWTGDGTDVWRAGGNVGVGTNAPATSLDLATRTDAVALPSGTTAQRPSSPVNGYTRYNTDMKGVEAYINGAWQQIGAGSSPTASEDGKSLKWNNTTKQFDWFTAGAAGSGIGTLNGLTASSQSFGIGTGGTAPSFDSQTSTHTLHIPMANTASVTAGLISKTEYDTFNSKLGTATSFSGDVSGSYNSTSVDKIKGKAITTPTASGQMFVYDGTGVTPVVMSGDATMIADGTMTLKNTGTIGTYFKVTTDAQGRVVSGATGLGTTEIPDLPWSKITSGLPTNLAGYGINDAVQNAGSTPSIQSGLDASKPSSGWTAGRIYIASDAKKIYRDDGSAWVEMAPSSASGVTSITAGSGLSGGTISATGTVALSTATQNGLWTGDGTDVWRASGKVGIGTAVPDAPLSVSSGASALSTDTALLALRSVGSVDPGGGATDFSSLASIKMASSPGFGWDVPGEVMEFSLTHPLDPAGMTPIYRFKGDSVEDDVNIGGGEIFLGDSFTAHESTTEIAAGSVGIYNGVGSTAGSWGSGSYVSFQAVSDTGSESEIKFGYLVDNDIMQSAEIDTSGVRLDLKANGQSILTLSPDGKAGIGTVAPNELLSVAGVMSLGEVAAPSNTAGFGKIYVKNDHKLYYMDESGTETDLLAGGGGSGIGTLNGLTASSQSFGIGTGGTAPNFDSNTSTHTLNIPMASTASVTAGLISKTQYDTFNNKLGTGTSFSGDVSGAYNATSVDKIKGKAVTTPTASGQMLVYDGTGITPVVMSSDATMTAAGVVTLKSVGSAGTYTQVTTDAQGRVTSGSSPTTLSGYGITDGVRSITAGTGLTGGAITGSGTIGLGTELAGVSGLSTTGFVKRTGAGAYTTASSMGVADLNFAGTMATNTGVVVRDGTQFYNKTCSGNEVLAWSVSNGWSCSTVVLSELDPKVGSNTTNALSKWNGSALVASAVFESSGSVGIGTTTPAAMLDVKGEVKFGNTSSACDATTEGQQRYNSTTKTMQFCNGTSWASIGTPLLGSLSIASASSCFWSTNSTSWVSYSATAACNAATVTGSATSSGKTPSITFATLYPGTYQIRFRGYFGPSDASSGSWSGAATACSFQITDGTTAGPVLRLDAISGQDKAQTLEALFSYASTQNNVTFAVQARRDKPSGTGTCVVAADTNSGTNEFRMGDVLMSLERVGD